MHTADEVGTDTFELRALECWRAVVDAFEPRVVGSGTWVAGRLRAENAFAKFFEGTIEVWRGIAGNILRRWKSPTAIEDVLQEMRMVLWARIMFWDPERGVSIARFLRWGATVAGKRWVHQERGANKHGTRDKNPSRYALPFSSFGREGDDESRSFDVPVDAVQERVVDVRLIVQRCRTAQDRRIVKALVAHGGCIDEVLANLADLREMEQKIARKLVVETVVSVGCELADFRAVA